MKASTTYVSMIFTLVLLIPILALPQHEGKSLRVAGHSDSVPVIQINGRNYVDVEALARLTNGSLTLEGNHIILTLPRAGEPTTSGATNAAGFSTEFLRAAIEELSTVRAWHSALTSAVENQTPISQSWLAPFEAQALTNLRLAQIAMVTDDDHNASDLIAGVYRKMKQLNDNFVTQRSNLSYIAPDSLKNDDLNRRVVACGKSLGAMVTSGRFTEDSLCH